MKEFNEELQVYLNKTLKIVGELAIIEIRKKIKDMKLTGTTELWSGWNATVENGELIIESTVEYAAYLEYGTFAYWDRYGISNFPSNVQPKKKDMQAKLRKNFPKGMQPFAMVRRVF